MPLPDLALALLALLLAPGPTNTLLALAGAERGAMRGLWALPLVMLAYLATSLPLALIGGQVLDRLPQLRLVVTLAAALWVLWLALRLWRLPAGGAHRSVGPGLILATTLMNPKALIIGLALLPAAGPMAPRLGLLCAIILIVSAVWLQLGSLMGGKSGLPPVFHRLAAGWLALLSLLLAAKAFTL